MSSRMHSESDYSWMMSIEVMLGSLDHREVHACSINSVPDAFRDSKHDTSFKPKLISIGPLHRGTTRQIQFMEETKWRYMSEFLNQIPDDFEQNQRLRNSGADILKLDKVIRATYGNNIESEPHELAKTMMVDGFFLLELLFKLGNYTSTTQKNDPNPYANDPIFKNEKQLMQVLNDVSMLENQIPFFVLKKLYRNIQDYTVVELKDDYRVAELFRKAFNYAPVNNSAAAHVLHLMHMSSTIQQSQHDQKRARQEMARCATRLRASGVLIQAKENNSDHHKLEDNFDFQISFQGKILEIPPLHIKETTEVKWRNLIAWEQSRNWVSCIYSSHALFFQGLICCKHDIKVLVEKKVIVNECGKSQEDLLTLFRTISKGVEHMDSRYSEICESLNKNRGTRVARVLGEWPKLTWHQFRRIVEIIVYYWQNWYRVLIRDHIPTVWKFIGVLAAILLIVLTIMQTYYSSRQGPTQGLIKEGDSPP